MGNLTWSLATISPCPWAMTAGFVRGEILLQKFMLQCCKPPPPPLIFLQPDLNPKLDTHLFFVLETAEHVLDLTSTDRCLSIFA